MLVHEAVSNAAHIDSAAVVRELWNTGKFTSGEGLARLREAVRRRLRPVMAARADGEPVPASFDELKPYIAEAIAEMTSGGADPVLIVNSDKDIQDQQEALDFDKGRVWRILVGGTKLSRGFTVEGLTVSYFRRKAGQADTLMQAGRWFGFREGYRDLVRLYIRRDHKVDLYEAFEALLLDEEAFRDELGKYAGFDEDGKPHRRAAPDPAARQPAPAVAQADRAQQDVQRRREGAGVGRDIPPAVVDPAARARRRKHKANLDEGGPPAPPAGGQPATLPYLDPADDSDKQQHARVGLDRRRGVPGAVRQAALAPRLRERRSTPCARSSRPRPTRRGSRTGRSSGRSGRRPVAC